MYKFQQSNLVTDFISNLLYHYWLPTYETVTVGDYLLKDQLYIYNTGVIKCTQSGFLGGQYQQIKSTSSALSTLKPDSIDKQNEYYYTYSNELGGTIVFHRVPTKDISINLINSDEYIYTIVGDGITTTYDWPKFSGEVQAISVNNQILTPDEYKVVYNEFNKSMTITFMLTPGVTEKDLVYIQTTNNESIRLYCFTNKTTYSLYQPTTTLFEVTTYRETMTDAHKSYAKYDQILPYQFGDKFRKFTDNYIAKDAAYSTDLHERLGKFVQVYSDLTSTDLRPYYNFNSQKYIDYLYIDRTLDADTKKVTYKIYDEITNGKILIFPVRFNHTYTIAMDSPVGVTVAPIFFSHERKLMLKNGTDIDTDVSQEFIDATNNAYYFTHMSVTEPQYVEFKCTGEIAEQYYKYHKNLYMMIQASHVVNTSITVLEGKYKNINTETIVEVSEIDRLSNRQLNNVLTSKLTLLQLNTKESYPFSNRLIEYLFDCVIDHTWKLDGNIDKAQKLLTNIRIADRKYGIWNNESRYKFYLYALEHKNLMHTDINGNIDKDTEKSLIKSTLNLNGDF